MATIKKCDRCGVEHKYPEGELDDGSDDFQSQLIQLTWYLLCKQCQVGYRLATSVAEQEKQEKIDKWLNKGKQEEKDA